METNPGQRLKPCVLGFILAFSLALIASLRPEWVHRALQEAVDIGGEITGRPGTLPVPDGARQGLGAISHAGTMLMSLVIPSAALVMALTACWLGRRDRRHLEDGLERLRDLHEKVDESMTGALSLRHSVSTVMVSLSKARRILSWSSVAELTCGYVEREVLGRDFCHLLPARHRDSFEEAWRRICDGHQEETSDNAIKIEARRADGNEFPAELFLTSWRVGKRPFFACVVRDITERRQAEKRVVELARFPSDNPGPVLRISTSGELLCANAASEVLLKPWGCSVGRPVPEAWRRLAAKALKSGERPYVELEHEGRAFSFVFAPVVAGNYVNVYGQEITRRRVAERALKETNKRLEETIFKLQHTQDHAQQQRLHALGQMASGVAHDFNNALMVILGYSELLLASPEHLSDTEKAEKCLECITTSAQDAATVVERLREFYRTRKDEDTLAPVEVNSLVEQVVSLTEPRWKCQAQASGRTIAMRTELQEVPEVFGNGSEMREALTNLIFNSVDAMPEGGTISLRTSCEAGHLTVEVSDTGSGMTEEVRQRCLEPFFSTKQESGTGLGLSMVFGIVQRHSGTIDIRSAPGKGTTFALHFPVAAEGAVRRDEAPAAPTRALRVLVVDDEPEVLNVLSDYLSHDGHSVETAEDGREGISKFQSGEFDLVLTDQAMPQMSGDEFADRVKRMSPDTPVVQITGFGGMMNSSGEKPGSVDLVVGKPVSRSGLREVLAAVA